MQAHTFTVTYHINGGNNQTIEVVVKSILSRESVGEQAMKLAVYRKLEDTSFEDVHIVRYRCVRSVEVKK